MLTPVAAAGLGRVRDISHRKRRLADDSIRAQQRRLLRGPAPAYSYGAPHYYQNGRALHPATLTEEFGGGENELDPLNYTIPYMDKYLVMAMAGVLAVTFQSYKIPHSSCEFSLHDAHCVDKYLLSFLLFKVDNIHQDISI